MWPGWAKFEQFLADMGPRPKGMTLDRFPNQSGNYEPENCRWATFEQQVRNRRTNILLTFNGVTKCAIDWAAELGLRYQTVLERHRRGLPVELILSTRKINRHTGRPIGEQS